jgi:hypothetical protein
MCKCKSSFFNFNEYNEIQFYCKKHSKNKNIIEKYEIPNECSCSLFKEQIKKKCNQNAVCKIDISNSIINYYCNRHLNDMKKNNMNNHNLNITMLDRNKLQLEEIYQSMVIKLDELLKNNIFQNVYTILIEKQPPKNPRMKSIMSSLQSYFIIRATIDKIYMNVDIKDIHLINAKNKLSVYETNLNYPKIDDNSVANNKKKNKNAEYEHRKYLSVKYTENILLHYSQNEEYEYLKNCIENNESITKKDDLTDCYLQGRFYIEQIYGKKTIQRNNQWINYDKINVYQIPKKFTLSDKMLAKKKIYNLYTLKYVLHKYPIYIYKINTQLDHNEKPNFTEIKNNLLTHKYKSQLINTIQKFFGEPNSVDFFINKINININI